MITLRYTYDDRENGAHRLFDSIGVKGFFDRDTVRAFYPLRRFERLRSKLHERLADRKREREKRIPSGGRIHGQHFRILESDVNKWVVEHCRMPVRVWTTWGKVSRNAMDDACVMITFWHDADAALFQENVISHQDIAYNKEQNYKQRREAGRLMANGKSAKDAFIEAAKIHPTFDVEKRIS